MDGPAGEAFQDFGAQGPVMHHLLGDVRGGVDDAQDISHRVVGVGADDEVRRGQEEEVQDLVADVGDVLHEAAEFHRGGGGVTPNMASVALLDARWWAQGQMPQM